MKLFKMKTYPLIALIYLMFWGCSKKNDSTPTPTIDLVGTWKVVTFTITPGPTGGTTDQLADLRQIFAYNCSAFNVFYNFKRDNTFTETFQSTCQSAGTKTDEVDDGTWSINQTNLSLTVDDGTGTKLTNTYKVDLTPATAATNASMSLTFTNSGTTYLIKLVKD